MDTITLDLVRPIDLNELMDRHEQPCVSIYMPTHKNSEQKQQDPIRLKNLLLKAENELTKVGVRRPEAARILQPVLDLRNSFLFWEHQSEGLAFFVTAENLFYYHLPYPFRDTVTVGQRFYLKPLLPLLYENSLFYILELSKHAIRLFQATKSSIGEISLEGLIPDRAEHMKLHHDLERHFRFHSRNSRKAATGKEKGLPYFFGQGASKDCHKEDILQFFRKVDGAVRGMIKEDHRPLVPAGVDSIVDIYRLANRYPYLLERQIHGNRETTDERQLLRMARPLVEPVFSRERRWAASAYKGLLGTARIDNRIDQIIPAAEDGLIQTLFVPLGRQQWGRYDDKDKKLELHPRETPGDQDILDLAAFHTLCHKGKVYAVRPGEMPGNGLLNAIYRY